MPFPLHRPLRPRAVVLAGATFALALSVAAGPDAVAVHDSDQPQLPFKADVPRGHQWRDDSRLAVDVAEALPGRNAREAQRLAIGNLIESEPRKLRPYIDVGQVRHRRFTLTIVGDQACAIWPRHGGRKALPGPCRKTDREPFPHAAAQTATFMGIVYDLFLNDYHSPRMRSDLLTTLFSRGTIASLAWLYAPPGIGVSGVIDKNRDGLDDDARITLHGRGEAVCLRYAINKHKHSTYRSGICKNLPARHPHYPPGAGH